MKILTLTLKGFKLYKECQSFTFGMANHIVGGHGEGKTALVEAIVWCLKGCDIKGSVKGVKKRMMNPSSKEMKVDIGFEHSVGGLLEKHSLSRVSTARSSSCRLDGVVISQDSIDAWIGQTDLFLSIFSPGYFGGISGMKSRDVLFSMLPSLDAASVLQSLEADVQEALADYDLSQPLQVLQRLKEELRDWENHLQDTAIRHDSLQIKMGFQSSAQQIIAEDEQLKSTQEQILALEMEDPPALPEHIVSWEEELLELGKAYREEVEAWKKLHAAVQKEDKRVFFKRQQLLTEMKSRCQELLDHGFFLKAQIAEERKAFEMELADFHARNHQEMELLRQEKQKLDAKISFRVRVDYFSKEFARILKEIEDSKKERDRLLLDISCIQAFLLQYAGLQVDAVNRHLNHAEICLTIRKGNDGETSLHHRLLFNQKEYYLLSNSEKLHCAVELSTLAKTMFGFSIPIFLDDGDWETVDAQMQYFVASHVPHSELDCQVYAA